MINEQKLNVLNEMSDKEFQKFLKNKYGDKWLFIFLPQEEFIRCSAIEFGDISIAHDFNNYDNSMFVMRNFPGWK